MKISFRTIDDIISFTQFTEKLEHQNIDLKRGNQYLDGKSFLGLANVSVNAEYEVSIITSNLDEKERFEKYITNWERRN